jgi:hypothetical protein
MSRKRQAPREREAAVSEIVATVLLLGLSVALFSIVALQVNSIQGPAPVASADLGARLNTTNRVVVASYGGDALPLATLEVRLDGAACAVVHGPRSDVDGTREDGDGALSIGERVVTSCDATRGGILTVVGGDGAERRVLLHVTLPPAGGA